MSVPPLASSHHASCRPKYPYSIAQLISLRVCMERSAAMSSTFLTAAEARITDVTQAGGKAERKQMPTKYSLSLELCHLLGCGEQPAPMSADNIIEMLVEGGAIAACAVSRRQPRMSNEEALGELSDNEQPLVEPEGINRWQRALRPALAFRNSRGRDSWTKFAIHTRPTELAIRWDFDASLGAW